MKGAISGAWVYVTVLIFMVILIAYVSITINYSNAYETSEYMIKSIEAHDGFNNNSINEIDAYIHDNIHTVKHGCNDSDITADNIAGVIEKHVDKPPRNGVKYDYCISRTELVGNDNIRRYYYQIYVYFSFSLPVLGDLYAFRIPGETAGLRYISNDQFGEWQRD